MVEMIGIVTTILAVSGVLMNNRKMVACFYIWIVSNLLSASLHVYAGLWSLAARDLIFTVLAVEGIIKWRKDAKPEKRMKTRNFTPGGAMVAVDDSGRAHAIKNAEKVLGIAIDVMPAAPGAPNSAPRLVGLRFAVFGRPNVPSGEITPQIEDKLENLT